MDKSKVLLMLKDADIFLKNIEAVAPKARNQINSLSWKLREVREEINKPDAQPEAPSPRSVVETG
jgi:hypothetical protein